MNAWWGAGLVTVALVGCGSASKTNLTFQVEPPDGDMSCIGVAGFDVAVTSGTKMSLSGPLLNAAPVLALADCGLYQPFSIEGVDIDSPASVVVTGHDGGGVVRVQGTARADSLRAGLTLLRLHGTPTPPLPVLVVHWPLILGGFSHSEVARLQILLMGGGARPPLVDVGPGAYFSVEPGAYGVPANLAPDGADNGQVIVAEVTTMQGAVQRTRLNARWNTTGRYYETM